MKSIDTNISKIENQISDLTEKLELLKRQKEELESLPADKKIAILLHENFCNHNHTDGCSWHYEKKMGWMIGRII